ncbi:MAG: sugar transferase [Verrucomicrobia bacterium]|nr:sugar transferase [Verrucomicrobiota bacterium]MBV8481997.1 sugar transferase [Verrucomicrobiota bacterium]
MKPLEDTGQDEVRELLPAALSLADHNLTEECREFPYRIALLCLAGDAGVALVSQLAAFWVRFQTPLRQFGVDTRGIDLGDYLNYIICGSASLILLFAQRNTYDAGWLLQGHSRLKHVVIPCLLWGAGFLGFSLVFKFQPPISRGYVALATTTAILGLYAWRWCLYSYLQREFIAHKHRHRILTVGWTAYAQRLREVIENDASHPYDVVCCVSVPDGDFQEEPPDDLPHVGRYSDIPDLIKTLAIDIVLIVDASLGVKHLDSLASLCEMELVQFKVVPSYFSILVSGLYLETMNGIPILGVSRLPLDRLFNRLVKRLFDIIGAAVGLLLSIPVIAVFGTLVYIESPGPIFYRQRRSGRNGKRFDMLKVRSMRLDAERDGNAGWSTKDDPRRLRIGTFMRKWNIDETPQFWNVLKGDMSLVGPRPERPELIRNFKHEIPHYNARHTVKPGITGWAQVNGLRGDTDLTERITYDLYYVEHWNLLFDLQTMLLTFFRNKNAH